MEKGILEKKSKQVHKHFEINFTQRGNFKLFNDSVKEFLVRNKGKNIVSIIDSIHPLENLNKNIYEIKDHINLSGYNPLQGPNFVSLTNIYRGSSGIIVLGLPDGVHPNNKEKEILLKVNIKAYCYNLVPTAIFAASLGLKFKAFGIVQQKSWF